MATSQFWQRVSASEATSPSWSEGMERRSKQGAADSPALWMTLDVLTILGSAVLATMYKFRVGPVDEIKGFWQGTLIHGRSMGVLLLFLFGFTASLLITSKQLRLYTPKRLTDFLQEQLLSAQACLISGIFLAAVLYLVHAQDIPRTVVVLTFGLVALALSLRRLIYRIVLQRRLDRGIGTRNVLIVGTGPEAVALRYYLESIRHLGCRFKGFIESSSGSSLKRSTVAPGDVVGALDSLFHHVRTQFIDEVFFTTPCERGVVQDALDQAHRHRVDLRLVPDVYDGMTWNRSIEYIGHFPTIPLYCGDAPVIRVLVKRALDLVFSSLVLVVLSPLMVLIALAIKLDSEGSVLYFSERVGTKGRVFSCIKFRTMVRDADLRRNELMHLNERDGVLFKITNDPRITRLGHFLRKYSLDELPQFFNVLLGDMSVVGPRPLPACDVRKSKLALLRVLAVPPGITGLWQVEGRQDPSSDSYISLNVLYIENWSLWLDLKIILRTVGVVLAGTGV